jgi:hypothetical protein
MTEITRKWLEEQVSLTWTDDVSEWYKNSSELITNILNSLETSYIIKEVHTKELVPHAHTFDCKDWKTCDCPEIPPHLHTYSGIDGLCTEYDACMASKWDNA